MLSQVDEVRREMESRLDSQRRHMVQKESQLKNDVEELKVTAWSLMKVYLVHPIDNLQQKAMLQKEKTCKTLKI